MKRTSIDWLPGRPARQVAHGVLAELPVLRAVACSPWKTSTRISVWLSAIVEKSLTRLAGITVPRSRIGDEDAHDLLGRPSCEAAAMPSVNGATSVTTMSSTAASPAL